MDILTGKRILIISPEPWDHYFLSKHHLAAALCKLGNRVYFLNPPSAKACCVEAPEFPRLYIVNYRSLTKGLRFFPRALASWFSSRDAARIKDIAGTNFDVAWTFDPFRFEDIRVFHARWTIYHVADFHRAKYEQTLAETAQLIIGPSVQLLQRFDTAKTKCIGHMISSDFLTEEIVSTGVSNRIQVGYVGNLLSRFLDYSLLLKTVEENTQCDFIFIGDTTGLDMNPQWKRVKSLANVRFEGALPSSKLSGRLARFDMLWCCYDTDKYFQEASNSHKILEYLAAGKPVVSTRMAYYLDLDGILYMPLRNDMLPDLLKRIASTLSTYNNSEVVLKRLQYVKEHTFEHVLGEIDDLLSKGS